MKTQKRIGRKETPMKFMLLLSILFSTIAFPALGELTDADLNKIRLIVNESEKRLQQEIKTEIANVEKRLKEYVDIKIEGVDKQFAGIDKQFSGTNDKFAGVDKQFEGVNGKFEGVERQIGHTTNMMYGLIALIVAAIAIPQILIAWRSAKDRSLERQIATLTQEVETLKKRQIVSS